MNQIIISFSELSQFFLKVTPENQIIEKKNIYCNILYYDYL